MNKTWKAVDKLSKIITREDLVDAFVQKNN